MRDASSGPSGHPLFALQQQVGNQAVQELLRQRFIQAKLTISSPGDPDEQEADQVADHVMRAPAGSPISSPCTCADGEEKCEACSQKGSMIQRRADGRSPRAGAPGASLSAATISAVLARSGGQPLDAATRAFFEPRFGRDLSSVRVHTGQEAAESAQSISALAYTAGSQIVFGSGQYAPDSPAGARLLAHELAHVGQNWDSPSRISRQSAAPNSNTPAPAAAPEDSLRSNIEEMRTQSIPQFQASVDLIDNQGILAAGGQVNSAWQRIENNYNNVPAIESTTPTPENPATEAKPADVERDYKAIRPDVLRAVGTQVLHGVPVLEKVVTPNDPGNMSAFIDNQTAQVAWVAKDTVALIALLRQDKLIEGDQWQAIGLLRQHLNPSNFAFMQAAVASAGVNEKFKTFEKGPAEAYQTLVGTTAEIKAQGQVGPADEVGLLAIHPAEAKVELLQPLSPAEVSAEIYGKAELWQTVLLPFNSAELANRGGQSWLPMGTELRVDPSMLVPQYASIFGAAEKAQKRQKELSGQPYLEGSGDKTAVVGNTITYTIHWPAGIWPDISLEWSIDYDQAQVDQGTVPKTEDGPMGLVSASGPSRSHNTSFAFSPPVTGTHIVHCRLSYGDSVDELSYQQSVITLEQKTEIEKARGFDTTVNSPQDILDQLQKQLNDLPDTPAYKSQRDDLNKRIADIKQSLKDAKSNLKFADIPATYISSADKPLRLPLRLFIGNDPDYNEADTGYHLKLWDYTMQGQPFTVSAKSDRIMPAIEALLKTFADDCYYPKGSLIAEISNARLTFLQIHDETLTLPTHGPYLIDKILQLLPPDVLRAISMGALGLGVATGLAGQEEAAVPLFELSVSLSGAAAAEELSEKLQHGQFKWDAGTVMQIADLAAALIGAGAAFELTTTVEGVGRMSLTPVISGLGKGIGVAQIGIVAGIHATEIVAAVNSKDKDKLISAILRALGDAAFFFIVHKATAGSSRRALPEGEPEFVPHEQLKSQGAGEVVASDHHDVVVTEKGQVFRCSDDCADLRYLFEQLIEERPEFLKKLQGVARLPQGERLSAARALYEELQGLQGIRNLSNSELADRIAKSKGSKYVAELKFERLRREGVDLSAEEILEAPGMSERRGVGGKVPDPFESGNFAHAMYEKLDGLIGGARVTDADIPAGAIKEYTIPQNTLPYDKRPRIDRLDRAGETIYEIKPTSQRAAGEAQVRGYAELMDRLEPLPGGRKWQYKTVTYDEARVGGFLKAKGVLE